MRPSVSSASVSERGSGAPSPGAGSHRRLALDGLFAVSFVLLLSDAALSVAMPSVQTERDLGMQELPWMVSSCTLAFAAVELLAGSLADAFGARLVSLLGVAVFSAASLLAGLSPAFAPLIASRLLQGAGAALITQATLSLIVRDFAPPCQAVALTPTTAAAVEAVPPRQSGLASGLLSMSRTIGLALGVSVMGALVTMSGPTDRTGIPAGFAGGLSKGLLVYGVLAGATAVLAFATVRDVKLAPEELPADVAPETRAL